MPKRKSPARYVGAAWPACRKCKSKNTTGQGEPPAACLARCLDCGHEWRVCGALRKGERRCGKPPAKGKLRCGICGGDELSGRPPVHGERSKYRLPGGLLALVEAELNDPDLLSHRQTAALLGGLLQQELEDLGEASSSQLWKQALALYDKAVAGGDGAVAALKELGSLLKQGLALRERRQAIVELAEAQARHKEREEKRIVQAKAVMTAQEARVFVFQLEAAIERIVADENVLRLPVPERVAAVKLEFGRLMRGVAL